MSDKGNLRKRFTSHGEAPANDANAEDAKLAAELAENVGKTVKIATELGLSIVENLGLKMMELVSPSKPAAGPARFSSVTSFLADARKDGPEMSGKVASKVTDLVASSGLAALRAANRTARHTRRPG